MIGARGTTMIMDDDNDGDDCIYAEENESYSLILTGVSLATLWTALHYLNELHFSSKTISLNGLHFLMRCISGEKKGEKVRWGSI